MVPATPGVPDAPQAPSSPLTPRPPLPPLPPLENQANRPPLPPLPPSPLRPPLPPLPPAPASRPPLPPSPPSPTVADPPLPPSPHSRPPLWPSAPVPAAPLWPLQIKPQAPPTAAEAVMAWVASPESPTRLLPSSQKGSDSVVSSGNSKLRSSTSSGADAWTAERAVGANRPRPAPIADTPPAPAINRERRETFFPLDLVLRSFDTCGLPTTNLTDLRVCRPSELNTTGQTVSYLRCRSNSGNLQSQLHGSCNWK